MGLDSKGPAPRRVMVWLPASLAGGDQFLCGPRHGSDGDATCLATDGPGATYQFCAACGDTVKGDGGCLPTAGHRAVGSQTCSICGPVGELSGPARRAIFRTCAHRCRTEKLPEKSH